MKENHSEKEEVFQNLSLKRENLTKEKNVHLTMNLVMKKDLSQKMMDTLKM
jgi:hypothetical protein